MRHKNTLVVCGMVAAFFAIMFFTMTSIKGKADVQPMPMQQEEETDAGQDTKEETVTAVVKKLDAKNMTLTATNVESGIEGVFSYTGGTKFKSRYGQEMMAKDVLLGEIVELTYGTETNKVTECRITQKAWEYTNIANWKLDKEKKTIAVGSKTFSYGGLFEVFNKAQMIDSNALSEKDLITVKGINGQAYSIIVEKGHGTFQLSNYADFVGGSIEIGYDVMTSVKEDAVFTLREGDYRVTVKKGSLEAVKYVHVNADELTTLDLSDSKKAADKMGKVAFKVTPKGADLYINNVATDYDSEVTLEYGTYTVKASCNGYETYTEKITVNKEKEEVQISLAASSLSKETASPSSSPSESSQEALKTQSPAATSKPSASEEAAVTPAATATASALSEDADHTLTVNGPGGVKLYLDGEYKGTLPLVITKVVGEGIECTLKKDGQSDKTYTMNVKDDDSDVTWSFSKWW